MSEPLFTDDGLLDMSVFDATDPDEAVPADFVVRLHDALASCDDIEDPSSDELLAQARTWSPEAPVEDTADVDAVMAPIPADPGEAAPDPADPHERAQQGHDAIAQAAVDPHDPFDPHHEHQPDDDIHHGW